MAESTSSRVMCKMSACSRRAIDALVRSADNRVITTALGSKHRAERTTGPQAHARGSKVGRLPPSSDRATARVVGTPKHFLGRANVAQLAALDRSIFLYKPSPAPSSSGHFPTPSVLISARAAGPTGGYLSLLGCSYASILRRSCFPHPPEPHYFSLKASGVG